MTQKEGLEAKTHGEGAVYFEDGFYASQDLADAQEYLEIQKKQSEKLFKAMCRVDGGSGD